MKTRVERWGESLAVRIPQGMATQTGLSEDSVVEVEVLEGQVLIRVLKREIPSLEQLLQGVTPENVHGEWDTGPDVGMEG